MTMQHAARVARRAVALCALMLGLMAQPAWAQAPKFYVWADGNAVVYTSSRLEDVQEPFLSIYRAQQLDFVAGPNAGAGAATGLEGSRAMWQKKRATAQAALLKATLAYAELKSRDDQLQMNPLLRLTPQVQSEHAQGAEALQKALLRYMEARTALLVTLPEEARKAQVPPAWLQ